MVKYEPLSPVNGDGHRFRSSSTDTCETHTEENVGEDSSRRGRARTSDDDDSIKASEGPILPMHSAGAESSASPRKQKLEYLEGLRGLAAVTVANSHFILDSMGFHAYLRDKQLSPTMNQYILLIAGGDWGKWGVALFFILSGRVLAISMLNNPSQPSRVASAFLRRFLRLWIPILGSLLFHWVWLNLNFYHPVYDAASKLPSWDRAKRMVDGLQPRTFKQSLANSVTLFVDGGQKLNSSLYPHAPQWTIPLELAGSYFIYVIALLMISYPKHQHFVYFALTFWFFWIKHWFANFMVGMWIASLAQAGVFTRIANLRFGRLLIWLLRCILAIVFMSTIYNPKKLRDWTIEWGFSAGKAQVPNDNENINNFVINYFYAGTSLILLLEITPFLQRIFEIRPVRFLGSVSFGTYLLHPIIYLSFGSVMVSAVFGGSALESWSHGLKMFIVWLSTWAMIILVSFVFWKTFDAWSISAGRELEMLLKKDWSWSSFLGWLISSARKHSPQTYYKAMKSYAHRFVLYYKRRRNTRFYSDVDAD
ncbi:acyltransferase family-domain-containing protein [Gaertneriomyces semiglobifer]|nr:acyltransferase family-domain-containing protein [Gaertneriomyces semiglobifer]